MSYVVLTNAEVENSKVLVNMQHVRAMIDFSPESGGRYTSVYFNAVDEYLVSVTESVEDILQKVGK